MTTSLTFALANLIGESAPLADVVDELEAEIEREGVVIDGDVETSLLAQELGDAHVMLSNAGSIERAAELVTEGSAMCSPEMLAGWYAFDAARGAVDLDDIDQRQIAAHLELLADAGGKFNTDRATNYGMRYTERAVDAAS